MTTPFHVCLGGELVCSGCNPCQHCAQFLAIVAHPIAMQAAGFNGSEEQANRYFQGLLAGMAKARELLDRDARVRAQLHVTNMSKVRELLDEAEAKADMEAANAPQQALPFMPGVPGMPFAPSLPGQPQQPQGAFHPGQGARAVQQPAPTVPFPPGPPMMGQALPSVPANAVFIDGVGWVMPIGAPGSPPPPPGQAGHAVPQQQTAAVEQRGPLLTPPDEDDDEPLMPGARRVTIENERRGVGEIDARVSVRRTIESRQDTNDQARISKLAQPLDAGEIASAAAPVTPQVIGSVMGPGFVPAAERARRAEEETASVDHGSDRDVNGAHHDS